jgi:hypothetical protein
MKNGGCILFSDPSAEIMRTLYATAATRELQAAQSVKMLG